MTRAGRAALPSSVPAGDVDGALGVLVPGSAPSIAALTAARLLGSTPEHRRRELASAARAPSAWAGRYVVPSGHTSPQPSTPSSVVTRTSVDGSAAIAPAARHHVLAVDVA